MARQIVNFRSKLLCAVFGAAFACAAGSASLGQIAPAQPAPPEVVLPQPASPIDTSAASAALSNALSMVPPVLSIQCSLPEKEIAAPSPLRNTAVKLEKDHALKILAIGSSSTAGVGASDRLHNYPSQLEGILEKVWKDADITVINRGISGEVASATSERLKSEAARVRPDLILWQLGTNDALSHVRVEDFEDTVRSTVRMLKQNNIDVVLVGLQYTPKFAHDESYTAIRRSLNQIADQEGLLYVRRYQAMEFIARTKANLQYMADDNFHLNDLGYQCMAEHIAQAVVANLFVKKKKSSDLPATQPVAFQRR